MSALHELEPKKLWDLFDELSKIPRPSKKEERVVAWIKDWAEKEGIDCQVDEHKNVLLTVPGTKPAPTIILQAHTDMVCEKNADTEHNFLEDALSLAREDGWITAKGTTLGADNGIGLVAALAVATEKLDRGPLKILLTSDEETGFGGAKQVDPYWLTGDILLNLDSEDWGRFTIGCAGGHDTLCEVPIAQHPAPTDYLHMKLSVTGLPGGHSGTEIHDNRGNAIKIMTGLLSQLPGKDWNLVSLEGGNLHNAIPREAHAHLALEAEYEQPLRAFLHAEKKALGTHKPYENLSFDLIEVDPVTHALSDESVHKILTLLDRIPHGVIEMDAHVEGFVKTSTNLAKVRTTESTINIATSQRSSDETAKTQLANKIVELMREANARVDLRDKYPGWQPTETSRVRNVASKTFEDLFGKTPAIELVHAGLECGVFAQKNPALDILSFGPTIVNPHSPDEKLHIESTKQFYELLKTVIERSSEL